MALQHAFKILFFGTFEFMESMDLFCKSCSFPSF